MSYYRLALAFALGSLVFLVLAMGALGILGAGGRPDRVYLAVIAVALVGALVARLRPHAMVWVMLATAATQALVTIAALAAGVQPDGASVADIVMVNAMYVALFSFAAWLFRRATEQGSPVAARGRLHPSPGDRP